MSLFHKIKIAWRSLRYNRVFTLINIIGLSVGLTVVLIICAMIYNEYSFDKSFPNGNRIYRMNSLVTRGNPGMIYGFTAVPFGPAVKEEVPEVELATRTSLASAILKVSDQFFKIENFCWADEDFFLIFDTPFIYGSPETALLEPGSVALSESRARILFEDKNPIGEIILVDGKNAMTVQAVYKDFPTNSSFADYEVIGQFMSSHHPITPRHEGYYHWGNIGFETFCLLVEGADVMHVEEQMQQVLEKNDGPDVSFRVQLQAFERIHLYSGDIFTFNHTKGDIGRLKMLLLLAGIILVVACINYMNLSTARAQKRSKYIGISKTFGARRGVIIRRLYAETALITFIAFAAAFLLSVILLPVFNRLMGQQITSDIFLHPLFLLGLLALYLITAFLAASYPAFYLSGFAPLAIIRQGQTKEGSHAMIRKGLSIIQFSVAVVLMAWVFIISLQIKYITDKDLGYDVTNVMAIPLSGVSSPSDFTALKNDFEAQSSVSAVAFTNAFPLSRGPANSFIKNAKVMQEWRNGKRPAADETTDLCTTYSSPEIIDLLRLKLIASSEIDWRSEANDNGIMYAVINRKAVEFLETTPEEVIGTNIYAAGMNNDTRVVGVVEDFNYLDLHEPIGPYCFYFSERSKECLLLRINEGDMSQQLASYEAIFKKHFPNDLFEVIFPSLRLQKAYEPDRQTNRMAICFSVLAIMVACLGVFGLTAFMAEQRTKEIGIRKVLGASVSSIVHLFTSGYIWLLLISLLIAIPVAWWVGERYLQDFAYRISLTWFPFVFAALVVIVVTLLTVCIQAIKAAMANPVKSIKME